MGQGQSSVDQPEFLQDPESGSQDSGDETSNLVSWTREKAHYFVEWRALITGTTTVLLSAGIYTLLATMLTSVRITSLSAVANGMLNNFVFSGVIYFSFGLGSAIATTYWYSLQFGHHYRRISPKGMFLIVTTAVSFYAATLAFLNLISALFVLLYSLLIFFLFGIIFAIGLYKRNGPIMVWGIYAAIPSAVSAYINSSEVTPRQSFPLQALVLIGMMSFVMSILFGNAGLNDRTKDRYRELVSKLDSTLKNLDRNLLAAFGFEIPYQRAAIRPDSQNGDSVLTPPANIHTVKQLNEYFNAVSTLETNLSEISSLTDSSARATDNISKIINKYGIKDETASTDHRIAMIDQCVVILEAYDAIYSNGDKIIIQIFEDQVEQIVRSSGSATVSEAKKYAEQLEALISEYNRYEEFRTTQATVTQHWTDVLDIDQSVIDKITSGYDHNVGVPDNGVPDNEVAANPAGLAIDLAKRVEQLRIRHDAAVVDHISKSFGISLRSTDNILDQIELLHRVVDTVQLVNTEAGAYGTYPFDQPIGHLLSRARQGTLTHKEINKAEKLITDAVTILSGLETIDDTHPSVDSNQWRKSVQTGLENFSPESVRPPAKQIEQIGDKVWEHSDLTQPTWEEFEHVVAAALESHGYETEVTQSANDFGVDVWAQRAGIRTAVQVKQNSSGNTVGRPVLQKLASTIAKGDADKAMIVTSSTFASTAEEYAAEFGPNMELVDGNELVQMLTESDVPPPV